MISGFIQFMMHYLLNTCMILPNTMYKHTCKVDNAPYVHIRIEQLLSLHNSDDIQHLNYMNQHIV